MINASTPGLLINESFYGVEGGQVLLVDDIFYLFITEFTAPPRFVPANLALWKTTLDDFPYKWQRVETIFKSTGICSCNVSHHRDSLGSSIVATYDNSSNAWLIYYVGFESCNNQSNSYSFVNRRGQIFLSQSINNNNNNYSNISGPYQDISVVLEGNNNAAQYWENEGGVCSFSNPYYISKDFNGINGIKTLKSKYSKGYKSHFSSEYEGLYYAFYGSDKRVGLVQSESLYGPWIRLNTSINPVSLITPNNHTEQPIVYEYEYDSNNNTYGFGAFWDTLNYQQDGDIGYNWSPNGIDWDPNCMQLLQVNPVNDSKSNYWGLARTPQGMIAINQTHFYQFQWNR